MYSLSCKKRIFAAILGLLTIGFTQISTAEEMKLDSAKIKSMLAGNSVAGVHYGSRTIQYFSDSGLTLWMKEGDEKPSEGQWKVENDSYCSKFGTDWGCYQIVHDADQDIHYFIGDNFRAPFVSKSGFEFSF